MYFKSLFLKANKDTGYQIWSVIRDQDLTFCSALQQSCFEFQYLIMWIHKHEL